LLLGSLDGTLEIDGLSDGIALGSVEIEGSGVGFTVTDGAVDIEGNLLG